MRYEIVPFIIDGILFLLIWLCRKKGSPRTIKIMVVLYFVVLLGPMLLPRQIFGTWNAVSTLNGKTINQILLQTSAPKWKVNLVGSPQIITNRDQIDTISDLLKHTELYFPGHPLRIWETKMIVITNDNDSFAMEIYRTSNNGTIVKTPTNEWRKDGLGKYLEIITNYAKPVLGNNVDSAQ